MYREGEAFYFLSQMILRMALNPSNYLLKNSKAVKKHLYFAHLHILKRKIQFEGCGLRDIKKETSIEMSMGKPSFFSPFGLYNNSRAARCFSMSETR